MKTLLSALVVASLLATPVASNAKPSKHVAQPIPQKVAEFLPSTYTTYVQLPAYKGEVKVESQFPPVGKFIEIGIVRVKSADYTDYQAALLQLKVAAAKFGATVVVPSPDAQLFAEGRTTDRGTQPEFISATAITVQ